MGPWARGLRPLCLYCCITYCVGSLEFYIVLDAKLLIYQAGVRARRQGTEPADRKAVCFQPVDSGELQRLKYCLHMN